MAACGRAEFGQNALDFGEQDAGMLNFGMAVFASDMPVVNAALKGKFLILDSAAIDHVFPSREDFERYSTVVPADKTHVRTADGRAHPIFGVGMVRVLLKKGESVEEVMLNALHVPSLGQ